MASTVTTNRYVIRYYTSYTRQYHISCTNMMSQSISIVTIIENCRK